MRKQKSYYWVFGLKDGTIWLAMHKRKPGGRTRIDEDGIFNWSIEKVDDDRSYTDTAKVVRGATIATCLNMKRLLREHVVGRLDLMDKQLAEMRAELTAIREELGRRPAS